MVDLWNIINDDDDDDDEWTCFTHLKGDLDRPKRCEKILRRTTFPHLSSPHNTNYIFLGTDSQEIIILASIFHFSHYIQLISYRVNFLCHAIMLMVDSAQQKHLTIGSQPAVMTGENQSTHL